MKQLKRLSLAQAAMTLLAKTAPPTAHRARMAVTLLFTMLTTMTVWAWEGDGTQSYPYKIKNANDLVDLSNSMSNIVNYRNVYFEMTNDIIIGSTLKLKPIGFQSSSSPQLFGFQGHFNGNNHLILLYDDNSFDTSSLHGSSGVGLFGCIGEDGEVENLSVMNVHINGQFRYAGSIAGVNFGTIDNCHLITSKEGIVSYSSSIVNEGYNDEGCNGGIVGANFLSGTVIHCSVRPTSPYTVTIDDNNEIYKQYASYFGIGGIVGYNTGNVSDCFVSSNDVIVKGCYVVGGIVGKNEGTITLCRSSATIDERQGKNHPTCNGGIVGLLSSGTVESCLADGVNFTQFAKNWGAIAGDKVSTAATLQNNYHRNCLKGGQYKITGAVNRNDVNGARAALYVKLEGFSDIVNFDEEKVSSSNTYLTSYKNGGLRLSIWSPTNTQHFNIAGAGETVNVSPYSIYAIPAGHHLTAPTGCTVTGTEMPFTLTLPTGTNVPEDSVINLTWAGNTQTIHFDKNAADATGTTSDQVVKYGTPYTLNANQFTRPEYDFLAWNTKADGTGDSFADRSHLTAELVTVDGGTITLYAQWEDHRFSITYVNAANGNNGVTNTNPTNYNKVTPTFTLTDPTRVGHNFMGWFEDSEFHTPATTTITLGTTGDLTFYAKWEEKPVWGDGDGSSWETAYEIYSTEGLDKLANEVNGGNNYSGKYFKLTNDIAYDPTALTKDNNKSNYTAIGSSSAPFYGHFDGQGHTISGIVIYKNSNRQGLFGYIGNANGEVKNIVLTNTSITCNANTVGGIAGELQQGSITNCHVSNSVAIKARFWVGGIVGEQVSGTISNCSSAATITGNYPSIDDNQSLGGIVGRIVSGTLTDNLVIGATITKTSRGGAITGGTKTEGSNLPTAARNYYINTTLQNSTTNIGTIHYNGNNLEYGSVSDQKGEAEPGYLITFSDGITASGITTIIIPAANADYEHATVYHVTGKDATVTPSYSGTIPAGYAISDYTVKDANNDDVNVTENAGDYTFKMPNSNVTVSVVFAPAAVTISNGGGSVITSDNEITVPSLNYTRNLSAPADASSADAVIGGTPVNVFTLCLPYAPATGDGIKYYTLSGSTSTSLQFEEITGSPAANTPYLVTVSAATNVGIDTPIDNVTLKKNAGNSVEAGGYKFVGTTIGLTNAEAAAAGAYILQNENKWGQVLTTEGHTGAYIPPFRAYIVAADVLSAPQLNTEFGGTTGIQSMQLIDRDGTSRWYDLNGRRIEQPTQKGVYINNGKKVVIK